MRPDFVEFHDYGKDNQFAKIYIDRESDKRIQVISGLPMARSDDGTKIVPGFEQSRDHFYLKNNSMGGYVTAAGEVHVATVDGRELHMAPLLAIGKEIVRLKSVRMLAVDPQNDSYQDNVIEIDYGICVRRIRIIEGILLGSWTFHTNPGAEVKIDYGRLGNVALKTGMGTGADHSFVRVLKPAADIEYIEKKELATAIYPVTIGDTAECYPSASARDGRVSVEDRADSWTTIKGRAGDYAYDSAYTWYLCGYKNAADYNAFVYLFRSILTFNTTSLGVGAAVTAAVISIYGGIGTNGLGGTPKINIVTSNPTNPASLTETDFSTLGSTRLSAAIEYASWDTGGYNSFTLNATGIAAVVGGGISKYGIREDTYDIGTSTPVYIGEGYQMFFIGRGYAAGASYKPKLSVTYTPGINTPILAAGQYRRRRI
jgi:hypothetical protein